jgi:hypothetical protein
MRNPKIKIPKIDLLSFSLEQIVIDEFWNDLIENGDKQDTNTVKNIKKQKSK